MEEWLASDLISDNWKLCLGGAAIGTLFGACAQRSQFCLRAACSDLWSGQLTAKVAIWLLVFGIALTAVQWLITSGEISVVDIRQLDMPGTLSGAILGGAMFGIGMILARGCASRLLVLSATGNVRALVAGLVVTVVAQSSLTGVLSPLREGLSALWVVGPSVRNMMLYLPDGSGMALGVLSLIGAVVIGWRAKLSVSRAGFAVGVGAAVALGWAFTSALSQVSFDPVAVGSVTFTGPSADTLMALISQPYLELSFGIGLVPGVFLGSFFAALLSGEFKVQTFDADTGTVRYLIGASLMGFGGMLAGGCAVGAGITGGAVMALTAWVALFSMWMSAGMTSLADTRLRVHPIGFMPTSR